MIGRRGDGGPAAGGWKDCAAGRRDLLYGGFLQNEEPGDPARALEVSGGA